MSANTDRLFTILALSIGEQIDDMAATAHFEVYCKHRAALKHINAMAKPLSHPAPIYPRAVWQPLVKQHWLGLVVGRIGSFKRLMGKGYRISDAWYLAGKFN